MARDYVKSSNRQRRRQQRSQASFSAWWLVTGALVLLFIAGLYYLKQNSIKLTHQNQDKTEKSSRHASTRDKQDKKAKEPAKTAAAQPVKPQFDFYTVLPESKVEVPKNLPANKPNSSPLTKPKPPAAPAPSTATDTKPAQSAPIPITNYVLQIAAVKDATEADRLKAELTLQGFSPVIAKIKVNNVVLNRITLGPYRSLEQAQSEQRRLKENHVSSLLLKAK